ncbi:hypothetical protein [Planctellipticum variicoloris]|uniref:hypothetical protein n=1 Tax=Planctellipticum variicoloris TaxID=3064265 RepID=UPI003013F6A5|nr:hypothetical protein SH412_003255 [Planctomycetaceae bacterium SH412]
MPINPIELAHGIGDEFLRSLFSAFPLSDPELTGQARARLERRSSLDIPLVRGLLVETLAGRGLLPLRAETESKRKWAKESLGNLIPVKPKQRRTI